jgi:hypothetical protein
MLASIPIGQSGTREEEQFESRRMHVDMMSLLPRDVGFESSICWLGSGRYQVAERCTGVRETIGEEPTKRTPGEHRIGRDRERSYIT